MKPVDRLEGQPKQSKISMVTRTMQRETSNDCDPSQNWSFQKMCPSGWPIFVRCASVPPE